MSIFKPGYCGTAAKAVALGIAVGLLSVPALGSIRKPPTPTPPSTPGNFHVIATTTSSVTFAWNASTNGSGGSLGYDIVNDTTGFSNNVGDVTSYTWNFGLEAGGTYSFHIYAYSGYTLVSANSPEITATLQGTPLPVPVKPAPPVITQASVTSNTINVVWTEANPANEINGYTVAVNGMGDGSSNASTTTALATGLIPSYTYTVTVTAYSLNGVTGDLTTTSAPVNVTTAAATTGPAPASVLTAPTDLNGWGDGGGEAIISWNPSISANEPQQDIQYDVYINGVLDSYDGTVGQTSDIYIFPRGATEPAQVFVVAVDNLGNVSAPSNVLTGIYF
ncbi:MAG: fibronectin type III domain-containing protein [Terracidiphilus sp.]